MAEDIYVNKEGNPKLILAVCNQVLLPSYIIIGITTSMILIVSINVAYVSFCRSIFLGGGEIKMKRKGE